jgi:sugar phosphate permease
MDSSLPEVDDSPATKSFFSVSTVDDEDNFWWDTTSTTDSVVLPAATQTRVRSHLYSSASDTTPLVPRSNILFGGGHDLEWNKSNGNTNKRTSPTSTTSSSSRPTGWAGFFFGFMYEEAYPADDDDTHQVEIWNRLNWDLFLAYSLTTAATALPITLIPAAAMDLADDNESAFCSRATASAVMGVACGKLLNGPAGDVFGARRVSCVYAVLLSTSLLALSLAPNQACAVWACFAVEFCQSVQWPCIIVILAAHYNLQHKSMYEGGIYVTSLASRLGSLVAIPVSSLLLRRTYWRVVAQCGALVSLTGAIVMFLFVSDSPHKQNDAQNPISEQAWQNFQRSCRPARSSLRICMACMTLVKSVFVTNVVPALRDVLKSATFWIVAIAHTGSSMVRFCRV